VFHLAYSVLWGMSACCYRAYIFFSISVQFRGNPPNSRNSGSMQMVENFFLPSRKLYLGCKEVWPIKSSDHHLLILKPRNFNNHTTTAQIEIIGGRISGWFSPDCLTKSYHIGYYWPLDHCGPMIISLVGIETTIYYQMYIYTKCTH
jgi:hypothetical protein